MKIILFVFALFIALSASAEEPLLIHEWGTITSYQSPDGSTVKGINQPQLLAEKLPPFVHRLEQKMLRYMTLGKSNHEVIDATTFAGHPDVTMRLETPILYFYPPKSWDYEQKLSVGVSFYGGLLNEYYPDAITLQNNFMLLKNGRLVKLLQLQSQWLGFFES